MPVSEGRMRAVDKVIERIAPPELVRHVAIAEKGKGSHYAFQDFAIQLDKEHLEGSQEEAVFVAAHEAGHARISKGPDALGLRPEVARKYYGSLGFAYGLNCEEDCAVGAYINLSAPHFLDLSKKMRKVYDEQFAEEFAALHSPETVQFMKTFGFVPKFVEFGTNLMRFWHQGRYATTLDPEGSVAQALARVQEYSHRFIARIPDSSDDTEKTLQDARQRFTIFAKYIWPEMNALVKEDLARQEVREFLRASLQIKSAGSRDASGMPLALDQLPKDLQEEIEKILQEGMGGGISSELEEELKKALEELSEKDREKIREQAKKSLEDLEDALNVPLAPHTNNGDAPEMHEARRSREAAERAEAERARVAEEERRRARQHAEDLAKALREQAERGKSAYDKAYERVLPFVDSFVNDMRELFRANASPTWGGAYDSGGRISLRNAFSSEGSTNGDMRPFERREGPSEGSYRFHFLIDLSGSMQNDGKIAATFDAVVFLYEAFKRLDFPFEISGFQDELISFVSEEDKWKDPNAVRRTLGEMPDEVTGSRAEGRNCPEYNDDGYILQKAAHDLAQKPEQAKCIVILSDGAPVPSPGHRGQKYALKHILAMLQKQGGVHILAGGLGDGGMYVEKYYPQAFTAKNVQELVPKMKQALFTFVEQYAKTTE